MNKKYYVASRASIPERSAMWRDLRSKGINIVSTWIDEAGEGETHDFSELWSRIQREIESCDTLVFYAEHDDFPLKGAYVEVGMALALNKNVIVVTKGFEPQGYTDKPIGSWIRHPNVKIVNSINKAFVLGYHKITYPSGAYANIERAPDSYELRYCKIEWIPLE